MIRVPSLQLGLLIGLWAGCTRADPTAIADDVAAGIVDAEDTTTGIPDSAGEPLDSVPGDSRAEVELLVDVDPIDADLGAELVPGDVWPDGAPEVIDTGPPCDATLTTSHTVLIPSPAAVQVVATACGQDVTISCTWKAFPPEVCKTNELGSVRKTGDGTCEITCTLPNGTAATVELVAKKQTVIYVVGGDPWPSDKVSTAVMRFRATDNAWDTNLAVMQSSWSGGAIGAWNNNLFFFGGGPMSKDYQVNPCPSGLAEYTAPQYPWQQPLFAGCREIQVFDLTTGTFDVVGEIPWVIGVGNSVQVASSVYATTYTPSLSRYDMATGIFGGYSLPSLSGTTSRVARWGESELLGLDYKFWHLDPAVGTVSMLNLDEPNCSLSGPTMFSFPASGKNVFIHTSAYWPGDDYCSLDGPTSGPYPVQSRFWRYFKGTWSKTPPFLRIEGVVPVVAKDAVYLLPEYAVTPIPTYRLPSADATAWEELAPMPESRSDYMAIAVEQ